MHDFHEARVSAAMRSVCSTLGVAGSHEQHIGCYHHQNLWLAKLVTLENALPFCNLLPRLNLDFSASYVFRAVSERLFHRNSERVIGSNRQPAAPPPAPAGKFACRPPRMPVS